MSDLPVGMLCQLPCAPSACMRIPCFSFRCQLCRPSPVCSALRSLLPRLPHPPLLNHTAHAGCNCSALQFSEQPLRAKRDTLPQTGVASHTGRGGTDRWQGHPCIFINKRGSPVQADGRSRENKGGRLCGGSRAKGGRGGGTALGKQYQERAVGVARPGRPPPQAAHYCTRCEGGQGTWTGGMRPTLQQSSQCNT